MMGRARQLERWPHIMSSLGAESFAISSTVEQKITGSYTRWLQSASLASRDIMLDATDVNSGVRCKWKI